MMFLLLDFPLLQYLLTYEYFFVFQGRIVGNDPVGLFLHQLKLEAVVFHPDLDKTYKELQKDYSLYARFKAFRERRIYGCNTHRIPFYEESPFHPEILLKDMVKIFHPELLEGYEPKYFSNLAE